MGYLLNRLKEPSTWRGLILFAAGAFGLKLGQGTEEIVIAIGVAASGALGTILPDRLH